MQFEFLTSPRIIFGPGTVRGAGAAVSGFGSRAFIITGSVPSRASPLLDSLQAAGLVCTTFPLSGEPSFEKVELALAQARAVGTELVLGFGGGSAIDAAKAVAVLLANPGPILDYVEVVGAGKSLLSVPPYPASPCPLPQGPVPR